MMFFTMEMGQKIPFFPVLVNLDCQVDGVDNQSIKPLGKPVRELPCLVN